MYITFTIKYQDRTYDIQADDHQTIRSVLDVLYTNYDVNYSVGQSNFVKTFRQPQCVSIDYSLAQAGVFSGEILTLLD